MDSIRQAEDVIRKHADRVPFEHTPRPPALVSNMEDEEATLLVETTSEVICFFILHCPRYLACLVSDV